MRVPTVILPRSLRQSFTRAAKKSFPAETFAFCLGTIGPSGTKNIERLFYPEIILDADGLGFVIPPVSIYLAEKLAKETKTKILGSVHSHPYSKQNGDPFGCAPSEIDWLDNFPKQFIGICQVAEVNNKLQVRYTFWPPVNPLILKS